MKKYIYIYITIINLFSFILFFVDKYKSKNNGWRIKEDDLIFISFIGGSIGSFIGMYLFHHKTKKNKFKFLIPILLIIQLLILFKTIFE